MTRFLHTADWQLGLAARHVAGAGERVRAARLETVARLLALAREAAAEFVLVAGDLFEDNQVSDALVHALLRELRAAALPILILPGNHDFLGPASVYSRPAFRDLPANVTLLARPEPCEVRPGVFVLPAPLTARGGRGDPTAMIAEQRAESGLRIGLAHGSLAIEGKHAVEDFPIALDAARRLDLDYLALGHWHSLFVHDGRCVYPGTPEPTSFGERESGQVVLCELEPGRPPRLTPRRVATLDWLAWQEQVEDASSLEAAIQRVKAEVARLPRPEATLLRLSLAGSAPPSAARLLADLEAFLRASLLHLGLDTGSLGLELPDARLEAVARSHPLLARIRRALSEPESLREQVAGLDEADLSPPSVHQARLLLQRLCEEIWAEELHG